MTDVKTKNAALTTALAFHYQVLIGLEKCFSLQSGQSVWFERDGDVSLVDADPQQSAQIEAKNYSARLTDHHENLWNTLKNWLNPKFQHENYGALILHTTQSFGKTTRLKKWNDQTAEERFGVLEDIFSERTPKELEAKKPIDIVRLQKAVMDAGKLKLLPLLSKIILHVEADDLGDLRKCFFQKLDGFIPKANQQAFAESLIGFIYEQADKSAWVIDKASFDKKREFLTAKLGPRIFTIPDFELRDATDEELQAHSEALFVKKINDIEYPEVVPEAVGNWIELLNSLEEELNGFPQFRDTATRYQELLIRTFNAKYRSASRKPGCSIGNSKELYDQVTSEPPFGIDGYENPDFVFRNGLIHVAMNEDDRDLKWRVKQ